MAMRNFTLLVLLAFALGTPGRDALAQASAPGWEPTNGPSGGTVVSRLLRHSSGDLFAGTVGGLFRSQDQGGFWSQVDTGFLSGEILALVEMPTGDVVVGTGAGVYRSPDRGLTWSPPGLATQAVTALVATTAGHLFAGTRVGAVYRSADLGQTWLLAASGLPGYAITALAASPAGTLVAGSHAGIYRSRDNGTTWQPAQSGLVSFTVNAIVYSPTKALFFAGTEEGDLFRSSSDGTSWARAEPRVSMLRALAVRPNGEIVGGTVDGILRFSSLGVLFSASRIGHVIVESVTVDPSGRIMAGTFGGGVYRSTNSGLTWQEANYGLGSTVRALTVNSRGWLFAGTYGGGVFRSNDGGVSWEAVNDGLLSLGVVALTARPDGTVFAGTAGGHVYRSSDDGLHWTHTGFPGFAVRGLVVNGRGDVFAGTVGGLFRYPQGGAAWVPTGLVGFDVKATAIAPDGQLYASLPSRLMRSPDGGTTWAAAGLLLEVQSLAINEHGDVFAGAVGGGVYRSIDIGEPALHWEPVDETLPTGDVRAFAFTPGGAVLAATYGAGVFYSTDTGGTWLPVNQGLTNPFILSFTVDPADGTVYAGSNGGVLRSLSLPSTAAEPPSATPSFTLSAGYPNPFRDETTITFTLAEPQKVTLRVFDVLGREVATLVDTVRPAGTHTARLDASSLAPGLYLCRLEAGRHAATRSLIRY